MRLQNKQAIILLAIAVLLVLFVFVVVIINALTPSSQEKTINLPSPTPITYTRDVEGNFRFTPLSKTQIGQTTLEDMKKRDDIISQSTENGITTFSLESATTGQVDEVKTQRGIVVSETTHIFNLEVGTPPKASIYEKEYGRPELILPSVSLLGKHISAYIYATKGFTLFVNPNTETVYMIQRFTPMSLAQYQTQYGEYVKEAPSYDREYFTGADQP